MVRPCKQLTPVLEKVVKSYGGKVRLVKINTDEHPGIAGQLRIQSFTDGLRLQRRPSSRRLHGRAARKWHPPIHRSPGGPEEGSELQNIVEAAEAALEEGDLQSAAEAFAAVLQEDQQNVAAIAGLAKCYLKSGDVERAEQTLALVAPDKAGSAPIQSVKAAVRTRQSSEQGWQPHGTRETPRSNAADHEARLELAIALAASGAKEEALDHLLELVRRDRNWNDQAGRKQLVQLFDAWGPKDR